MKKILSTGLGKDFGGIESFSYEIFSNLHKKYEFSYLSVTSDDYALQEYFSNYNVKVYYLPEIYGLKNALTRKKFFKNFLIEHEFDILHINATTLNTVYMAEAASELGVKVIYHVHNANPSGYGKLQLILTNIFKLIAREKFKHIPFVYRVSVSEKAWYTTFHDTQNANIILNGINTNKFKFNVESRKKIRTELGIDLQAKVGIIVARLMQIKNYSKVLSIVQEGIGSTFQDFIIIGDGPLRQKIEENIAEFPEVIKSHIHYVGEKTEVWEWLSAADFFILTSFTEGLATSAVEAQSVGLPAVVSMGVPRDIDVTKSCKFISNDSNNAVWLNAIVDSLRNKMNYLEMNKMVENSEFSLNNFIDKIDKLYM